MPDVERPDPSEKPLDPEHVPDTVIDQEAQEPTGFEGIIAAMAKATADMRKKLHNRYGDHIR